ncbi:hypothetical protein P154DRAFT_579285 [Amniculicola lignicola CBS 123094]|uniref:RING-type domain-containing protein n=1 Tax=Amniculicola lignicola CBS 123094 TaxID=1392246 RepID=A0A6A5W515_9PLEO|nr:hypothetical protein P154DRAFT_579285 [Amniculicola lignicola CBS 123094]
MPDIPNLQFGLCLKPKPIGTEASDSISKRHQFRAVNPILAAIQPLKAQAEAIISRLSNTPVEPYTTLPELGLLEIRDVFPELYNVSGEIERILIAPLNFLDSWAWFTKLCSARKIYSDWDGWGLYDLKNVTPEQQEAFETYVSYKAFGLQLQALLRAMRYRMKARICFALPKDWEDLLFTLHDESLLYLGKEISQRVWCILQRKHPELTIFEEFDVYSLRTQDPAKWRSEGYPELERRAKWTINIERPTLIRCHSILEWRVFEILVEKSTRLRRGFNPLQRTYNIDLIVERLQLRGLHTLKVSDFSDPCTADNKATSFEAVQCFICWGSFEGDDQAVRLRCGHVIGRACLKDYITQSEECPYCRKALIHGIDKLPEACRPHYLDMLKANAAIAELDEQVDTYLVAGPQDTFDAAFGELLLELNRLIKERVMAGWMFGQLVEPYLLPWSDDVEIRESDMWV